MPGNAGPVWSLPLLTVPGRMRSGMEVPELMTATQVARILGVSTETLRKWRARRMCLPYVRVGRHIRYKAADVAAFVERGTVMPAYPSMALSTPSVAATRRSSSTCV